MQLQQIADQVSSHLGIGVVNVPERIIAISSPLVPGIFIRLFFGFAPQFQRGVEDIGIGVGKGLIVLGDSPGIPVGVLEVAQPVAPSR